MEHLNKPILFLLLLFIASFITYLLNRIFQRKRKILEVDSEKIDEELNLLADEIKSVENANLRMRSSLERITHLKNMVEDYSQTLSEEDILDSVIKNSFELFKNATRVLLYLVDTEKQELKLVRSRKRELSFLIKAKKGDVFDRWVLKHRIPLLVEDIYKDFRFSPEELDQGFNSIISVSLTSEHKVLGILRIDSKDKNKFTQSDLRFLDIIADLSSVSLQNAILYKKIEELAIHDSLTGLYVHKYFIERLKDEVKSSLRNNMDICLLMLDLDNFKAYNDKYGHTAGDLVLKHISSILKSFTKPGDIVSRYGGEEFTLLLLNKGKPTGAKIAESIRQKINKTPLVLRREKTKLTVSIGVASCPSEEKMADELLRLADSRLYRAKKEGKNRVWPE
ncbi:MAG: sensor domain-containing diguanylate cyclase [Candidatus Omnitrophota bacterium]